MSNDQSGELLLFVKGPVIKGDKESKFGEDIFSHRFMFMIARKEIPNAKVVPVDTVYKKDILLKYGVEDQSLKLPLLVHTYTAAGDRILVDDPPQIEAYLEEKFKPFLRSKDPKAYKVQLDVFQKFIFYLKAKGDSEKPKLKQLLDELRKIDQFLTDNERQFLSGDEITIPDCQLLPKLFYIRIAGKYYKKFEIPDDLAALKRYIEAGDLDESFQDSKCSEKEIVEGFKRYVQ
ncbi:chloride intracellular channel protein 1-like [Dendronephthya gigantea]|uniref:chloride intracellular channel protein 1-like n=1 Tax=Dendronephthya gigantea TaxID=151771 RepID=UPI00106D0244|nr:chloride intracellular channel protein 1-like [Dendronephthya gigantea]